MTIPEKNIVKGAIRRIFTRSPLAIEARALALHPKKKGPRGGKVYICKKCKKVYPAKDVQVDHIWPVIRHNETIQDLDYNTIIERIFCPKDNLQVLCTTCHKAKTKKERKQKTKYKAEQKRKAK